jgi:hypothetical protein
MKAHEQLVQAAVGCSRLEGTPLERYRKVWQLYSTLDEMDPLDVMISLSNMMEDIVPELSEGDKDLLRQKGISFQEDWDSPRDYMRG